MHYLVAGCGYTGCRVLDRLPDGAVTATGRTTLDLDAETASLPALPFPLTVLYTVPPPSSGHSDTRLARFLALPGLRATRLVYLSTTGVYGDRSGGVVSEADEPRPGSGRAERRLDAERRLETWSRHAGTELLVLRVPAIYGPGRLGLDRLRSGAPVIAEADAGPGNRIHVDDLARCCAAAMTGTAPPGIYNVGDGDHRSATWFAKTAARLAGIAAPPEIPAADAPDRLGPARMSFHAESRIVDTTRMRELLGVQPVFDDAEAGILASLTAGQG